MKKFRIEFVAVDFIGRCSRYNRVVKNLEKVLRKIKSDYSGLEIRNLTVLPI